MFSNSCKRLFSSSARLLVRFKTYPPENPLGHRALVEAIGESKDQTAFFAWHPRQEFPYEFTRPLPTNLEQRSQSLLKDQAIAAAKVAFKLKHPEISRAELMRLTSTSKHRWFPRARDKKLNFKKTPMDRKYL